MNPADKDTLLADEALIIRHAGEIPEIAFHSALHYLTSDPDGPGLTLEPAEIRGLEEEVIARYREILRRDLDPVNRGLRIYRGIRRCIWNWERLGKFLKRQGRPEPPGLREEMAGRLAAFLENEAREICPGRRASSLNCTAAELAAFCQLLGIAAGQLPAGWLDLCPPVAD